VLASTATSFNVIKMRPLPSNRRPAADVHRTIWDRNTASGGQTLIPELAVAKHNYRKLQQSSALGTELVAHEPSRVQPSPINNAVVELCGRTAEVENC
jgi:hypothetical protein